MDEVVRLQFARGVRKHPGLYIADTGLRGLSALLVETMSGRLEEASPKTCSLELFGGVRFAFEDDGLPPPSSIEEVWPEGPHHALAFGWPFHLTVLPALSRACELTTDDGERAYSRHLQRGHVLGPPEPRQSEGRQRTRIEFEVDEET